MDTEEIINQSLKHRRKLLTYARKKHVVERYTFYSEVKRIREDDVIKILQFEECFYSESLIYRILWEFKPNPEYDKEIEELKKVKL